MDAVDEFIIAEIRKRLKEHGYAEMVINRVITMYSRPKPYISI